jgi:hypothetical protein
MRMVLRRFAIATILTALAAWISNSVTVRAQSGAPTDASSPANRTGNPSCSAPTCDSGGPPWYVTWNLCFLYGGNPNKREFWVWSGAVTPAWVQWDNAGDAGS